MQEYAILELDKFASRAKLIRRARADSEFSITMRPWRTFAPRSTLAFIYVEQSGRHVTLLGSIMTI